MIKDKLIRAVLRFFGKGGKIEISPIKLMSKQLEKQTQKPRVVFFGCKFKPKAFCWVNACNLFHKF